MSFFSNIYNSIQEKIQEKQRQKKEDQQIIHRLQLEAEAHRRMQFEDAYRRDSKEVAIAQAKRDAARMSGLQKLRATNRLRNLEKNEGSPGSFLDKLSGYTQKNIAKREENLKKTAEARQIAKRMREQKLAEQQRQRADRMAGNQIRKPFERTW